MLPLELVLVVVWLSFVESFVVVLVASVSVLVVELEDEAEERSAAYVPGALVKALAWLQLASTMVPVNVRLAPELAEGRSAWVVVVVVER